MISTLPQTVKHPQRAYVFDVDGVLTDPKTKKIEQTSILEELIKRLNLSLPIAFNTGRSIVFMDPILKYLEDHVRDKNSMQAVITVGEKGATWITYDEQGARQEVMDGTASVPSALQQHIKQLVKTRYAETMFFDVTKKTMVSIELESQEHLAKAKKSFADFKKAQLDLIAELKQLLENNGLQTKFKIDPTIIATDVENVFVGKALGARRIFSLLHERKRMPTRFVSFGDSPSDIPMHQEFQRLNGQSTFVYVGVASDLEGVNKDDIVMPTQRLDKGTLEFLRAEELPLQD